VIGDVLAPTHLIFILLIALLVLGPKRLPEVGRSLGKGIRDFRGALSGLEDPLNLSSDAETPAPAPAEYTPVEPSIAPQPPGGPEAEAAVYAASTSVPAVAAVAHEAPSVTGSPASAALSANAGKAARSVVDPADPGDYAD
jgi:sec-independent protein translocase protein TatA